MTAVLAKLPPWLGGARSGAVRDGPWRNVPTINVAATARRKTITPTVWLLILVVLVELFAFQFIYRSYSTANANVETVQKEIEAFQTLIEREDGAKNTEEDSMADLAVKIQSEVDAAARRQASRVEAAQAFDEFGVKTDWAGAFELLLQADRPDLSFQKITAEADGKIEASGIVADIVAIGRFQEHMRTIDDVLDLLSLQLEDDDESQTFSIEIQVR
jgi:hypothetical protein